MKNFFLFTLISVIAVNVNAQKLKTYNDSLSYAFGISIVSNLTKQGTDTLNPDQIEDAFEDYYKNKPILNETVANQIIQNYFDREAIAKNEVVINQGKKFLAENAKKDGVVTTESGLQYKILKEGTGKKPTAGDKVEVHYRGRLIDGTEFDSSYSRGKPAVFGVTQVIKGWTEALMLMTEGAKWELYIPYDLAYGSRQAGQQIKPFSTLIFEVELISIK